MPPPPASNIASRLFLGPALRAQPDRRLVKLVREGYENAFEEIVRRYGKPLVRYAAAIVSPSRAEDVTQDAFSKALLALRGTDKEIELRPWLYRIVRNTALNDIRDQPPAAAELHEGIDGVETPAEAAERRAELADLLDRLRALPDPQRAAIVMRELEGLSHEEIASALGMSGGGARQAIYRARRTLRDGAGMLLPLPLLQYLLAGGGSAAAGAGLAGAGGGGLAAGAGGAGAGTAVKAGLATVLVAGSVAGGVALHDVNPHKGSTVEAAGAAQGDQSGGPSVTPPLTEVDETSGSGESGEDHHGGSGSGHRGGEREPGDDHGGGGNRGPSSGSGGGGGGNGESGEGPGGSGSGQGSGSSGGGSSSGSSGHGSGPSAGSDDSVDDLSGSDSSGSGSSGAGSSGSGSSGSGKLDESSSDG